MATDNIPVPDKMVAAMQRAADRNGVPLGREAWDIARAVLKYSDDTCQVTHLFLREEWESEKYRDATTLGIKAHLAERVLERKAVPTSLPIQSLRYVAGYPGCEVPEGQHDMVEVTLSIPVRYCEAPNGR